MDKISEDTIKKLQKIGRILDSIPAGAQRIHSMVAVVDAFRVEFGEQVFLEALRLSDALAKDRHQAEVDAT